LYVASWTVTTDIFGFISCLNLKVLSLHLLTHIAPDIYTLPSTSLSSRKYRKTKETKHCLTALVGTPVVYLLDTFKLLGFIPGTGVKKVNKNMDPTIWDTKNSSR
jgi:hypothetical protein